LTND